MYSIVYDQSDADGYHPENKQDGKDVASVTLEFSVTLDQIADPGLSSTIDVSCQDHAHDQRHSLLNFGKPGRPSPS